MFIVHPVCSAKRRAEWKERQRGIASTLYPQHMSQYNILSRRRWNEKINEATTTRKEIAEWIDERKVCTLRAAYGRLESKSEWHQTHYGIKFRNKNNGRECARESKGETTLAFSLIFIRLFWAHFRQSFPVRIWRLLLNDLAYRPLVFGMIVVIVIFACLRLHCPALNASLQ